MKITEIKTRCIRFPLSKAIKTAIHDIETISVVLVDMTTDTGVVGQGYAFSLNAPRIHAIDAMIKSLIPLWQGQNPHYIESVRAKVWQDINPIGHKGVTIAALSVLDTACWDIIGKALKQPLHHIFGACRDRVDTYASGGLWLGDSIESLEQQAHDFIAQGFRSVKMRVGHKDWRQDVLRAKALKNVLDDSIVLLADANQAFTVKQAIQLGKALQDVGVAWLEEPVSAANLKGHREVRMALDLDIASGETEYTLHGMHDMLRADSCDILMPDLQRIGGLTEMRSVASLARAYHVPFSTHIFTEQSLAIAGSCENCVSVEHMPWFEPMFNESMKLIDGQLLIPDRPGVGFTFDEDFISSHLVS